MHKTVDGKRCDGLVYAATDGKGKRTGVGIKSSDIGKSVGYCALQKRFYTKQGMDEKAFPAGKDKGTHLHGTLPGYP